MTIKKYTGKTKDEAIEAAKAELGNSVVIMNIKEVKGKGLAGMFKAPTYEVTAAVEEDEIPVVTPITPKQNSLTPRFSAVADEQIKVPPMESDTRDSAPIMRPQPKPAPVKPAFPVDENDLKSAFEEISAVVEKGGIDQIKPMGSQESPLVKRDRVETPQTKALDEKRPEPQKSNKK